MQLKRLRLSQSMMTRAEFDEKERMLQQKLSEIDNNDLQGLTFANIREFEEKLNLIPIDEETKRHGMEATFAERVKAFEEDFEEKQQKAAEFISKMNAIRAKHLK